MAGDILLRFDLGGIAIDDGSEESLRKQLERIVGDINSDPLKIKFVPDKSSMDEFTKTVQAAFGTMSAGAPIQVQATAGNLSEIETLLKEIAASANSVKEALTQLGSGGSLDGVIAALREIHSLVASKDMNFSVNLSADTARVELQRYIADVRTYVEGVKEAAQVVQNLNLSNLWRADTSEVARGNYASWLFDLMASPEKYEKLGSRLDSVKTLDGATKVLRDAERFYNEMVPFLNRAKEIGILAQEQLALTVPNLEKVTAQASTDSAKQLADVIQTLTGAASKMPQNVGEAFSGEAKSMDAATQSTEKHADSLGDAIKAEQEKEAQARQTAAALYEEAKAAGASAGATEQAAGREAAAVSKYQSQFDAIKLAFSNISEPTTRLVWSFDELQSLLDTINSKSSSNDDKAEAMASWAGAVRDVNSEIRENIRLQNQADKASEKRGKDERRATAEYNFEAGAKQKDLYKDTGALKETIEAELRLMETTVRAGDAAVEAGEKRAQAEQKAADATEQAEEREARARQRQLIANENAMKRSANLMGQMQEAQRAYSSAQNGEAAEAYQTIGGLIGELEEADKAFGESHNIDAYNLKIAELSRKFAEAKTEIKGAGEAHKSFGAQLVDSIKNLIPFFNVARLAQQIIRTVKEMVRSVIEFDDVLTQMQIVTGATESKITEFGTSMFETAQKIGASTSDLIDSATVFARLGYSLDQSAALAEYTSMLVNVGNIDTSSAQNAMTAIFKAFDDVSVNNIEEVMDKMVEVGNHFPISVKQLAEGMNNAGSTLATAGNSFDESLALLAASNATVQNISKASTGLRTITARLRKSKTELDDLGEEMTTAQYDEMVAALTKAQVSLTDQNGEFRSTYDILRDIAAVWDTIGTNEQAALAQLAAGTRQLNVFGSLIENFQEAENAMSQMEHSTGALQTAYDTYMDSTTAHLNQFRAAWQELSYNIVDTGFLNTFIDAGTVLIQLFSSLASGVTELTGGLIGLIGVFGVLRGIMTNNPLQIVAGVVLMIYQDIRRAREEAVAAVQNYADTKASTQDAISSLESLRDEYNQLSQGVDENGKSISLTADELDRYHEIANKVAELSPELVSGYDDEGNAILKYKDSIDQAIEAQKEYLDYDRQIALAGAGDAWKEYTDEYSSALDSTPLRNSLTRAINGGSRLGFGRNTGLAYAEIQNVLREAGEEFAQYELPTDVVEGHTAAIYENRDAILSHLAALRDDNGELVYTRTQINELRQAIYGLASGYKDMQGAQVKADNLLKIYAEDLLHNGAVPMEQWGLLLNTVSADLSKTWEENKAAVDDAIGQFADLMPRLDDAIARIRTGSETIDDLRAKLENYHGVTEDVIDICIAYAKAQLDIEDANDDVADSFDNATSSISDFASALRTTHSNLSELEKILSMGDLGDDAEIVAKAINRALELIDSGQTGSAQLAALKDFFGISTFTAEESGQYFSAMSRYFADGAEGVETFLNEIMRLNQEGDLDSWIAQVVKVGDKLQLSFDTDRIAEFAQALHMSEDVLKALLQNFGIYSEDFRIDGQKAADAWIESVEEADSTMDVDVNIDPDGAVPAWLKEQRTMDVAVSFTRTNGGLSGWLSSVFGGSLVEHNASGTKNAKRGMSLLGDEWSPNGEPRPELVVNKSGAYIAGAHGPTVGRLERGDQVYTYDETKRILSGDDIRRLEGFAAGKKELVGIGPIPIVPFGSKPGTSWSNPGTRRATGTYTPSGITPSSAKKSTEAYAEAVEETVEDAKKAFEDLYKYHKHLVAMDQESQEDFLNWLDGAYKDAYNNGAIELDDFRKYKIFVLVHSNVFAKQPTELLGTPKAA